MAAASMVPPALLRNSLWLLIAAVVITACNTMTSEAPIMQVAATDSALRVQNGRVFYHGQPYSGAVFALYPGSDTAFIARYLDGAEDGWQRKWHMNRRLAEERFYSNGKKEGIHKAWWEDGRPRFEYHFKDDKHEGILKEWFADGRISRTFHYVNGQEEGQQQMWWEDGRVRANYIVRNGERFGLLGQKLCKNNLK